MAQSEEMSEIEKLNDLQKQIRKLSREEDEIRRKLARSSLDGAEIKGAIEANADVRDLWVDVRATIDPYKGVNCRLPVSSILYEKKVRSLLEDDFPGAIIRDELLDNIECEAVRIVLHDLNLRVKKKDKKWLVDMKNFIDTAIVKSVQEK